MPAELKRCIKSWKRKLPDYKIKKWDTHNFDIYSIPFVAEACKMRKWAFACDYIRVYVLYTEGGIYMDSDVFVRNSLDFCLANRAFSAVECYPDLVEKIYAEGSVDAEGNKRKDIQYIDGIQIQAAILGAEKGHPFMRDCMNYYHDKHFILPDGSLNNKIISPFIFKCLVTQPLSLAFARQLPYRGEPLAKRESFPECQGLSSIGEVAMRSIDGEGKDANQKPGRCEKQQSGHSVLYLRSRKPCGGRAARHGCSGCP